MQIMDFNQIRINAVLGVCARQRELVAENRKLQQMLEQPTKKQIPFLADGVAMGLVLAVLAFCILF